MKKVLVFGVFDKLHPGHIHFLEHARALGDELVVAVARDSVVEHLKKRLPRETQEERVKALSAVEFVSRARIGDEELGSYLVLREENPQLVALGYDQEGLKKDLEMRMALGKLPQFEIAILMPHKPEIYKTSLLHP